MSLLSHWQMVEGTMKNYFQAQDSTQSVSFKHEKQKSAPSSLWCDFSRWHRLRKCCQHLPQSLPATESSVWRCGLRVKERSMRRLVMKPWQWGPLWGRLFYKDGGGRHAEKGLSINKMGHYMNVECALSTERKRKCLPIWPSSTHKTSFRHNKGKFATIT